jgi:hypothetical protein
VSAAASERITNTNGLAEEAPSACDAQRPI